MKLTKSSNLGETDWDAGRQIIQGFEEHVRDFRFYTILEREKKTTEGF